MKIRLIDVPEKLVPKNWQIEHRMKLLEIDDRCPALKGLIDIAAKDEADYRKLMKTVKLQLASKTLLRDERKVRRGRKRNQKKIIELKAAKGHSRLFAFLHENGDVIICTHTYWKTSKNRKVQDNEFEKAVRMRADYIRSGEGRK
jgi:hypothetical protein